MKYKSLFKKLTYSNRRLHIHVGLFLVLFIWLFSLSGLLLNHDTWKFASFWDERKENKTISLVNIPAGLDSTQIVNSIMVQLKVSGEVTNVKLATDSIDFSVSFPGNVKNIHLKFKEGICVQKELSYNIWGKLRTLHTFNGANKDDPSKAPNWVITRIWQFSMDAIAIGLIFLCFSSWIMWYKIKQNYVWGYMALLLGFAVSCYFIFLLKFI